MSLLFPTLSSQFIQSKDATTAITNFESNPNRQKVSATLTFGDDSNATVRPPRRRFGKKTRVRTFDNLRCILRYLFHFCFIMAFCLFLSLFYLMPVYLSLFLQLPSISCTSVCIFQSLSLSLSLSSLGPLCLFNLFLPLLYLLSPLSLSSSASSFFLTFPSLTFSFSNSPSSLFFISIFLRLRLVGYLPPLFVSLSHLFLISLNVQ